MSIKKRLRELLYGHNSEPFEVVSILYNFFGGIASVFLGHANLYICPAATGGAPQRSVEAWGALMTMLGVFEFISVWFDFKNARKQAIFCSVLVWIIMTVLAYTGSLRLSMPVFTLIYTIALAWTYLRMGDPKYE